MKETGHQAFKEGDYKLAATKYNYSVQLFQFVLKIFPYVAHEVLLLHNSLSACYYKMKDYEKALASANTCIELDNKEIKVQYISMYGIIIISIIYYMWLLLLLIVIIVIMVIDLIFEQL